MTKEAKRIGRPAKAPTRGERVSLGLKVTADIKRRIDSAARASGRTQSQEAEHRIELSYHYEAVLGELEQAKKRVHEIALDNIETALRRAGFEKFLDLRYGGHVWLEPGRHDFPKSGWIDPNDNAPPRPPRIIPEPDLVNLVKELAKPIAEAVKAELLKKEGGQ